MQVMDLYSLLEKVEEKDQISFLIRSLRKDERIWSFLTQSVDTISPQIDSLVKMKKLNPGMLGLLAIDPEIVSSGYPESRIQVPVLEHCMVNFEAFLQQQNPPESLELAAKLAVVLLEKRKISPNWNKPLIDAVKRMHISDGQSLKNVWGTSIAIVINLIEDKEDLLVDLLKLQTPGFGIEVLIHSLLSLPISNEAMAEKLYAVISDLPSNLTEKILNHLISINERELAELTARLSISKFFQVDESTKETEINFLDAPEEALQRSMIYKQIASIAQIAGETELASEMVARSIRILDTISNGMKVQNLSLLEQTGKQTEFDESIKKLHPEQLNDPALHQEFASVGYLSTKSNNKELNQNPVAKFQQARKIQEAGNTEMAKLEYEKNLNGENEDQIDQLINFKPHFNPGWNSGDTISILIKMDAINEAVKSARKLLEKNPGSLSANQVAAEAFMKAQKYSEALPLLEFLSISMANTKEGQRNLAECYKQINNTAANYKVRKQLIDVDKPEIEDLLKFAEAAVDNGSPEEVFHATSRIIEQDPDNTGALSINGRAYALTGNRELATEYFLKAIELGTDDASPWIGLSNLYLRDNDHRKAIETLRSGLSALPGSIEIKRKLADLLMESGSAAEALPLLSELSVSVKDVQVKILQVEAMKTLGLDEYKPLVDALYAQYPENPEIAQAHAAELIKEGKRKEAKLVMEAQIEHSMPGDQSTLTYADAVVGMDYQYSGKSKTISTEETQKIQEIIGACLNEDSESTRALLLQAELYANIGLHTEAFSTFAKLLEKQNSIDKSLLERIQAGFATSAAFLGKFELALAAIKQAVEAKPEWIGLRKVLAQIYAFAGEVSDGLFEAENVLNIGPQIVENIVWFVDLLTSLGKTEEAEKKLREVVVEHPDVLIYQSKLAEILVKNGKVSEASEVTAAIVPNLSSDLPDEELVRIVYVLVETGDVVSALACLEFRTRANDSVSAQLDLAGYLYQQKQFDKVLEILNQIKIDDESTGLINCLKADTFEKIGELENALELLQISSTETCKTELIQSLHFAPLLWKELLEASQPALQLQAEINFRMGKPSLCRDFISQWMEMEPENVKARILVIETSQALGENSEESLNLRLDGDDNPDVVYLAALKIVALLESDQVIEAQKIYEKFSSTDNLAIKATGIRFSLLAGHLAEAEAKFDEILVSRTEIDGLEEVFKIGVIRNLIKSAATLQRWSEAMSLSSEIVTNYSWHAACAMQYLEVMTRAKEFENTAKDLSIEVHNPSTFLQQIKMEEEINWLVSLLDGKYEKDVERWVLRAKMAVEPVAETIRAFALIKQEEDDAAAMVAALNSNEQKSTALQVARKFPNSTGVLFELARIQAEKDLDEAIETLNTLISIEPLSPVAMMLRGTLLANKEKLDLAINDLEQAISDWPNETNWRLAAAQLWQKYGNNPNAINQLEAAYALKPEDVNIALALSKALIMEKELNKAIEILKPLSHQNPNLYEAWEELADAYSQSSEMDQALDAAKKASEINPFSTKPYLMSGKLYMENGNLDKALEQAKQAVSQNKKDAEGILFLAKVLNQQGEKRQALATLEMTNQCENVTVQTMIDHVNLVKEINGGSYAKELIASLSDKYPENVELLKMLASVQVENGDSSDAEQTAKRALQVDPDEPDLHLFLGKINAESGQLDQAIHHLSQGITSMKDKMDGYLLLSKVYEQQREFTKALDALNQAMEIAPTDTRSFVAAANLYRNSKDYRSAEKVLQQAVEIDPKDVSIRRQLGALLALKLVHYSQEASSQS